MTTITIRSNRGPNQGTDITSTPTFAGITLTDTMASQTDGAVGNEQVFLQETDGPADEKNWYWQANGGVLSLITKTDDDLTTATVLSLHRTAEVVDGITLPKMFADLDLNGQDIIGIKDITSTGDGVIGNNLTVGTDITKTNLDIATGVDIVIFTPKPLNVEDTTKQFGYDGLTFQWYAENGFHAKGFLKVDDDATVSGTDAVWSSGAGTPEGAKAAVVGSMYTRTDGGAGTTLYIKESGTGLTGWVGK